MTFRRVICPECRGWRRRWAPTGGPHRCRCCRGKGTIR
jgi:hypothetical protein